MKVDTADFEHATIFSNSTKEGLGSWGDADNDYQISTGGFKDITVAYPVPHHIRRNYTLRPLIPRPGFVPQAGMDSQTRINSTFTQTNVDFTINGFTGDFPSFQVYHQNVPGSHPGPHLILGGDMVGTCPFGLQPPACIGGQKWSPNGRSDFSLGCVRVLNRNPFPCT